MKKSKIIIIDGTYYLYKFYYTFPTFKNKKEEPTGAIFGFINMLSKMFFLYNPKNLIVVFDSPAKNFRKILFSKYKSNRKKMPLPLQKQISNTINIIKYLGIPVVVISKFEADDVIGTLSKKYEKKNYSTFISTKDKDMAQLVSKKIKIIDGTKKTILGIIDIKKKYGVFPKQICDFLGLIGDKSDNIPGIRGIGKKTAILLLENFDSLKEIYKNIKKISNLPIKRSKNIEQIIKNNKKKAFLSKKLATINTNVPIKIKKKELKLKNINIKKITLLLKKYEFKNWENIINAFLK
ncbi:DNA polymerase I [Buchnera aphidicola (Tetraneura ulmi)]|uniref:5'-3' exonuclease n=1 Tax=Buchnera aphidicola TaxID=9 RepID=UPI003463DC90